MDTVQSLVHEVYVPERLGLNRELYYSRYRHFKIMESFSSNQLRALSTASGSGSEAPPAPGSQEEYCASLLSSANIIETGPQRLWKEKTVAMGRQ
jgi:hypothetical protein